MSDTNGRYKISALLKQQSDEQVEATADDRPQKQTQQAKQPKKAAAGDRPKKQKHLSANIDASEHLRWQTAILQWKADDRDEMPSTITDLIVVAVAEYLERNA